MSNPAVVWGGQSPTSSGAGAWEPRNDLAQGETISLDEATEGPGIDGKTNRNPLVASASNLLVLLGRLRTGYVRFEPAALRKHVSAEIDAFRQRAGSLGVSPGDLATAEYVLAATADDLVQNSTGVDVELWRSNSLAWERFQDRNAGTGFYERLEEALRVPQDRYDVLELMLVCLAVGFHGAMRGYPDAERQLAWKRTQVHQELRRVRTRPQGDLSRMWIPVILRSGRRGTGLPVWVAASAAAALLVSIFFALSWLLDRPTSIAGEGLRMLHTERQPIQVAVELSGAVDTLQRPVPEQIERLRTAFAPEIADAQMTIDRRGNYIEIKVSQALRFSSGSATLDEGSKPLVTRIARVLNDERGDIVIEGHTDSDKPSQLSKYKTNQALSRARAETVLAIMAQTLRDPDRLEPRGKGDTEADVPNTSPENKALNRRVEILLLAEDGG